MRIIVNGSNGKTKRIVLPTGMFLNRITASVIPGMLEKKGISITREQALRLAMAVRSCRRSHPEWKMVEIVSSNGEHIEISL